MGIVELQQALALGQVERQQLREAPSHPCRVFEQRRRGIAAARQRDIADLHQDPRIECHVVDIAEGRLDVLIFFVDPLSPQPHDVDIKALIRMATLANIPFACNPATADLIAGGLA